MLISAAWFSGFDSSAAAAMRSARAHPDASLPMAPTPPQAEATASATDADQPTLPAQPDGGGTEAAEAADAVQCAEAGSAGKGNASELRPSGRSDSTSTAGAHMLFFRDHIGVWI